MFFFVRRIVCIIILFLSNTIQHSKHHETYTRQDEYSYEKHFHSISKIISHTSYLAIYFPWEPYKPYGKNEKKYTHTH